MRTFVVLFSLFIFSCTAQPSVQVDVYGDPDAPVYYDEGYVYQDAHWSGPGWYWGVYFDNENTFWGWHGNHWGHNYYGGGHYYHGGDGNHGGGEHGDGGGHHGGGGHR